MPSTQSKQSNPQNLQQIIKKYKVHDFRELCYIRSLIRESLMRKLLSQKPNSHITSNIIAQFPEPYIAPAKSCAPIHLPKIKKDEL